MGILILEDDTNVLMLIKDTIRTKNPNIAIYEATDPLKALEIYEKNKFNIEFIICDYLLPIQNGSDFIEIVKSYSPKIKVCVFTGDASVSIKKVKKADQIFYKEDGVEQLLNFIKII